MFPKSSAALFAAFCAFAATNADAEVLLLDIDRIGPAALARLKADPGVEAWSELGDTLVVQTTPGGGKAALQSRQIATLPVDTLDALVSRIRVHCSDADPDHKHAASGDTALFERGHWQLWPQAAKTARDETLAAGRVVAYQQANREAKQLTTNAAIVALVGSIDIAHWRTRVNELAGFQRLTAAGYESAAQRVQQQFTALGLEVSRQTFTPPVNTGVSGRNFNVLGLQRGGGQGLLIVGAHLDSRNRTWDEAQPSPGAEDNASGCAGVIETARVLRGQTLAADVLYICYGLEERGLYGSVAHAALLSPSQVLGVINMDMIAFNGDGRLDVSLQATAAGFGLQQRLADNAARYTQLEVEVANQTCCSDHQPYLNRGIPAVLLIENDYAVYPQYHSVDDTAERISDAMAHEILKMAVATAAEVGELQGGRIYSGYWFDPAQSGHGFQIEIQDSGLVFLTWYTFDAAGQPMWLIANGSMANNRATLQAYTVSGGRFPPAFDAAAISTHAWGSFDLNFADCGHAEIRWTPLAATGLAAGSINAVRASDPLGGGCDDD